ncbi:MAG: transcriptional regulator [Thermoprotei archaeon]
MSEIPLKPIGKENIRKLELALILGTLFRSDVLESIKIAEDKVTWLDSLIIAAGALARERGGLSISKIAEELGRTETTIRNHLAGKTEAGKIIRETYEKLLKSGTLELQLPLASQQFDELKRQNEELERQNKALNEKLNKIRNIIEQLLKEI